MKKARAVVLVIDGGGVGASEDAARFGDGPSVNSLGNTAVASGGLRLPNLERLGIGWLSHMRGVELPPVPLAACARLREMSKGKDSVTGHWEMMGITVHNAFPTYPDGFPPNLI